MIALRWTRRMLDGLLIAAVLAVALVGGLALLVPALGGQTLVVGGGSMEPAIPRGSYVLAVRRPYEDLRVGDIVTVREGTNTPFTHRITRFATLQTAAGPARYVETKGDADSAPDPYLIPEAGILGRVELDIAYLGYLAAFLATPVGLVGFLALCLALLSLIWLIEEVEERACPACQAAEAARRGARPGAGLFGFLSLAAFPLSSVGWTSGAAPIEPDFPADTPMGDLRVLRRVDDDAVEEAGLPQTGPQDPPGAAEQADDGDAFPGASAA